MLRVRMRTGNTWDILDNISHQCTEVTADVLQCVRVLVIFCLKQLPGEVNVLEQGTVQRVTFAIQPSAGSLHMNKRKEILVGLSNTILNVEMCFRSYI